MNTNNEGATRHTHTGKNSIASTTPVYYNGSVGTFAKYTTKKGAVVFGMIDSIFNGGLRVGFVHGDSTAWTSELIWAKDIAQCTDADEIRAAHDSAVLYYENETEDLRARIARRYEIDDEQKLATMLAECELWLAMLTRCTKDEASEDGGVNCAK